MESRQRRVPRRLGIATVLTLIAFGVAAGSAYAYVTPWFNPGGSWIQRGENIKLVAHEGAFTVKCPTMEGSARSSAYSGSLESSWGFSSCTTSIGGTCTSPGEPAGHIRTTKAAYPEAALFYLSKATHEVGVVFNRSPTGGQLTFMTFSCSGGFIGGTHTLTVRGSALAKIGPVKVEAETFQLNLGALSGEPWVPLLTEYEYVEYDEKGNEHLVKEVVSLEIQEKVGSVEHAWQPAAVSFGKLSWAGARARIEG
jgi:hypothetical protein